MRSLRPQAFDLLRQVSYVRGSDIAGANRPGCTVGPLDKISLVGCLASGSHETIIAPQAGRAALLWFLGFELDLLQDFRLFDQFLFPGGKPIAAQNIRQDISILLPAQRARSTLGHGDADALK